MSGVPFVRVPTTLLTMVDPSVGGDSDRHAAREDRHDLRVLVAQVHLHRHRASLFLL